MNVIDLMQSLEMGRKSCQLSLSNEGDKCEVFFAEGQVKHATYGSLVGDEAVFKVLRWTGGNFQLDFEGKTDKETTQLNTQGLLMEGLRLLDESSREGGAEPEPDAAPVAVLLRRVRPSERAQPPPGTSGSDEGRRGRCPPRRLSRGMGFTAAVVTVSDSCARGEREDLSGPGGGATSRKASLLGYRARSCSRRLHSNSRIC